MSGTRITGIIPALAPALTVALVLSLTVGHNAHARGFDRLLTQFKPIRLHDVQCQRYDGDSNDLLTGGLGKDGLASPTPPLPADPLNPTAEELRTLAIYNNYRAIIDTSAAGGYGRFYGPVEEAGPAADEQGRVPGLECLGYFGFDNVTAMVQVPDSFDPGSPCIVTGPSSGSRGVYGAIGSTAGWAFGQGCAMAYTDKGTGTGAHDLREDTVNLQRGEREEADAARFDSNFTTPIIDRRRLAFNEDNPYRFAFKHQYSRLNPEARWGEDVLDAIRFAFWILNERYEDRSITPRDTAVIAAGVSNGGGAAVQAAEEDRFGLIDGVVVSEPNVTPRFRGPFTIDFADNPPFAAHSEPLYSYITFAAVYESCANAVPVADDAPLNLVPVLFAGRDLFANRCASLAEKGLLTGTTLEAQAAEARQKLLDFGFLEEQLILDPSYGWLYLDPAVAATYVNAYSRARPNDVLCGFTFGATEGNTTGTVPGDGSPRELSQAEEAIIFGTSSGVPPSGGVEIINNESIGGPRLDRISTSPSIGRQDENLDGYLCTRSLYTGVDPATGQPLTGRLKLFHERLTRGIRQVALDGDLDGKPAIIIAGRSDALVPVNHAARAYYGFNQDRQGGESAVRYYEVTNAHHLDTLNASAGFDTRFIPLHHYFTESLELMLEHLRSGTPLPPSQVVRTEPRGGTPGLAPPLEASNIPPIADPAGDREIVFTGDALTIPE